MTAGMNQSENDYGKNALERITQILQVTFPNESGKLLRQKNKCIMNLLNMIHTEVAISPRLLESLPTEIRTNIQFQSLLIELSIPILSGDNAIELLQLIFDYPELFQETDFIFMNEAIQKNLRRLYKIYDDHGQGYILGIIQHFLK